MARPPMECGLTRRSSFLQLRFSKVDFPRGTIRAMSGRFPTRLYLIILVPSPPCTRTRRDLNTTTSCHGFLDNGYRVSTIPFD